MAVAEGFALAGGVVAGTAGLVTGVGLGLAGAGGFRFGGGAGVAGVGECVVALALEARRVVAGGGDLLACCFRGCVDLLGGVAAELVQLDGESSGGFLLALGVIAGRGGIVAGGLEGLGECLGLGLGFCLAGLGGDSGCLGAPQAASASAMSARTRAGSRAAAWSRAVLARTAAWRRACSRASSGPPSPTPEAAGTGRRASLW